MATKPKSQGAYPQADPTAPGGMSKADLRLELAEKHGISMDVSRTMSWPQLIDEVCQQRLAREREIPVAKVSAPGWSEPEDGATPSTEEFTPEEMHEEQDTNVNDFDAAYADDLDALLAEFEIEDDADLPAEVDPMEDDFDDLADLDDEDEDEDDAAVIPEVVALVEANLIGGPVPALDGEIIEEPVDEQQIAEFHEDAAALDDEVIEYEAEADEAESDETEVLFDPETLFAEMQQAHAAEQNAKPVYFLGLPGIKDYVFDGHAGAGPSASERWISCTMSLSASRKFLETLTPNQQAEFAGAGVAARQGTTAHAAAETEANLLLGHITPEEAEATLLELTVEPDAEAEAYDSEMAEYITEYVDLVRGYASDRGTENVRIEGRVEAAIPLTDMHEGEIYVIRGSGDVIVLPTEEDPNLVVGDLKYGEGIFVDVEENPQVRLYALGALEELTDEEGNLLVNVETVTYYIAQPRLGGLRTWTESLDDLLDWRDEVLSPALTKALYGAAEGATYEPSDAACQWCPARGTCPALAAQRTEEAAELFDAIADAEFENGAGAFPETDTLDDATLARLLSQVTRLVALKDDLKDEAQRRLYRGTPVPGYQLVNYTPPRKWNDDALHRLDPMVQEDEGALLTAKQRALLWKDPTLLTPTQAEKILGPEGYSLIEEIVVKPDKRPVVAPEGDRRKTWTGKPPEEMFAVETGEESE